MDIEKTGRDDGTETLVFSCSGAADVGEIADLAARQMNLLGMGRMFCLAGVGGRVSPIVETARKAEKCLAIDGCPMLCAMKTLDAAGIEDVQSLCLTDFGFEKGCSDITEDAVTKAIEHAATMLKT